MKYTESATTIEETYERRHFKRRNLFIVVLGISFLILMTILGTMLDSIIPHPVTPSAQTAQAGPYKVILQVTPNPPRLTQPATLTLQLLSNSSTQPIMNAHIVVENSMETMDMGTDRSNAQIQPDGFYKAQAQFSMSGPWQVRIIIDMPGTKTQSALFTITAQ